ncbi:30S ribosomal protein S3 [bacterium]|nr:30S ribosomal protein S3 [bacterium]MBL7052413.1 30S ribosomal protein S3 [Candidatus Neomarinimicrobiota bacterium]
MGQKTHPIGLRLGISKSWSSTWFDEKKSADFIQQDILIRKYIKTKLANASVADISISRTSKRVTIKIRTARPGIVIGKGGEEVERLKAEMKYLIKNTGVKIDIEEIKRPEINAELIGQNISQQLVRKINHRRAMKKAIQAAMRLGAEGIKITCAGRLGGAEIARCETLMEGRVPLHTLRADIDHAQITAHTTYGCIGIKVWVCNGEVSTKI